MSHGIWGQSASNQTDPALLTQTLVCDRSYQLLSYKDWEMNRAASRQVLRDDE
jgi:hypothetical protein